MRPIPCLGALGKGRRGLLRRLPQAGAVGLLPLPHIGIEAVMPQQGRMSAMFNQTAISDDMDQIGISDGGQPVSDREAGPSAGNAP